MSFHHPASKARFFDLKSECKDDTNRCRHDRSNMREGLCDRFAFGGLDSRHLESNTLPTENINVGSVLIDRDNPRISD